MYMKTAFNALITLTVTGAALATVQAADEPKQQQSTPEPQYASAYDCYEAYGFPHEVLGLTHNENGQVVYDMTAAGAKNYPCLKFEI